jgi:hypothetical protein
MLHISGDPFDAQLQLAQLRWVTASTAGAAGLAENYAGLPGGFLRPACPAGPSAGHSGPTLGRLPSSPDT